MKEVCSLRDAATDLEALGARVAGISLDDVQTQRAFRKAHELSFPLLSDPDGSAAARYEVLAGGGLFASRVTFVIDPQGILRHIDRGVRVAQHGEDLVGLLGRLQAAQATD